MKASNPTMRIAIVTTFPPGDGSLNEYAYHFVSSLREKPEVGEVILLTDELRDGHIYPENGGFDSTDGAAPVSIVPCWRFGAPANALRILQAVRRIDPDIVLFNIQFATFGRGKAAASLGLAAPALLKAAGYATIVLLHNIMETVDLRSAGFTGNALMAKTIQLFGNLFTRLLLRADLVALTIPKYVELLREKYAAENLILAPHGTFETPPEPDYNRELPTRILTFGKFGTYKRIESLVEATQRLRGNGHPSTELVVAGTDSPNTPGYLAGVAEQYRGVGGLKFTGYVAEEDVPTVFQEAAIVVFPYTSTTGSSGVLHQAGSYGKAVVLPRIGDFAELVEEEGYTGAYFEPENVESLKQAIAQLLDNTEYRCEMGRRNYLAACGLPIAEVADWYVLHMQAVLQKEEN